MKAAALLTVEFILAWSPLEDVLPVNPSRTQTEVDVGHNILITEPDQKKKTKSDVMRKPNDNEYEAHSSSTIKQAINNPFCSF